MTACWQPSQPLLTFGASSASAPTLAALEEPFSLPRHCGSPSLGWPRPELAPSACGEVWRERPGQELGLRTVLGWVGERGNASSRYVWVPRARTQSGRLASPALGSEGLSTWANSCRGYAGSPNSAGPRCCAGILAGPQLPPHGAGLGTCSPPCPSLHPAPAVCSCVARASLTSPIPCTEAPGPIDHARAEKFGHMARDWRAPPLPILLVSYTVSSCYVQLCLN